MVSEQRSNSITSETAGRPQNGRPLMRPPASLRAYQSSIDGQTISGLADSTLTLSMAQDVTVVKTLLLRLRRILQEVNIN